MTDLHTIESAPSRHPRPPETWAAARDDYLAGVPADTVAERHGVSLSALRTRAREDGWRRVDQAEAPPPPDDPLTDEDDDPGPVALSKLARRHAHRALRRGRVSEAQRWTRIAIEWDRAAALFEDDTTCFRELVTLARATNAVGEIDFASAQMLKVELRKKVGDRTYFDPEDPDHAPHPLHRAFADSFKPKPPGGAPDAPEIKSAPAADLDARLADLDRRIADLVARRVPANALRRQRALLLKARRCVPSG